jgi:APA family basic amino acid/polyamine antiporter
MAGFPENPNPAIDNDLKQTLGPIQLIALGIGAIIGAGIFVLTGHAAASYAGSGVVISFAIAGTGCLFAGLCYAEYAAMIPVAGSAYTYTFATMGRFLAWIIGWNLVLEYLAAGSTVAVGWSGYFSDFMATQLHTPVPTAFAGAPFTAEGFHQFVATGAYFNLPAVLLVAFVTFVLIVGVNMSATFNAVMVAIKLCIVLVVIFVGFSHINPVNHGRARPVRGRAARTGGRTVQRGGRRRIPDAGKTADSGSPLGWR